MLFGEQKIRIRKLLTEDIPRGKHFPKKTRRWAFRLLRQKCRHVGISTPPIAFALPITPLPLQGAPSLLRAGVLALFFLCCDSSPWASVAFFCEMDQVALFKVLSSPNILGTCKEMACVVIRAHDGKGFCGQRCQPVPRDPQQRRSFVGGLSQGWGSWSALTFAY